MRNAEFCKGKTKKYSKRNREFYIKGWHLIDQIRAFVEPMVEAINCNEKFIKIWKHDSKSWEEE